MRCCGRRGAASVALLACLFATSASRADDEPPWVLGAQFVSSTTHFDRNIDTVGPGVRGSVLARVAPRLWLGAEMAAYAWVQPDVVYVDELGPRPLDRGFQAGSASLVLHTGPRWRYRPYWVVAVSIEQETGSATFGAGPRRTERVPGWAIGLGTRGSRGATPWLEWRWHQSFGSMAILGDRRLVYHTLGVGVAWN